MRPGRHARGQRGPADLRGPAASDRPRAESPRSRVPSSPHCGHPSPDCPSVLKPGCPSGIWRQAPGGPGSLANHGVRPIDRRIPKAYLAHSGAIAKRRPTLASFRTTVPRAVGFVPDDGPNGGWLRSGRRSQGRLASFRTTVPRAVGFVPDDGPNGSWLRSGRRSQRQLASFRTTVPTAVGFVPDDGPNGSWLRSGRRPSGRLASFRTTAIPGSTGRRRRGTGPGSACIPAPGRSRQLVGPVPTDRSPSRFPEIDIEAGRLGPAPPNLP